MTERILLIQTAFIGDAILATALVEKLAASPQRPLIDLLVRKGNQGLFEDHPHLNKLLIWEKDRKYPSLLTLLKQLRATNYNRVINIQRFGATGLLTALSGAKHRVGFAKNPFSFGFTEQHTHEIGDGTHEVERNHQLIASITDSIPARPKLYPQNRHYERVRPLQEQPYICLAPTSVWFTKQFPAEKWVEFMDLLPSGYQVYLLGGPGDKDPCDRIADATTYPDVRNLAGELNFLESAALMEYAVMNYVNDSAPLHIASSMNAPVTAIFCSTVPNFGFGPLSADQAIVETLVKLDCRPCGLHGHRACPKGHFRCAHEIKPEQLTERLEKK